MIVGGTKENRFVIPRWLAYKDAQASGELAMPGTRRVVLGESFVKDMAAFRAHPTPVAAADLLGIAFVDDRPEGVELATYLLQQSQVQRPTLIIARRLAGAPGSDPKKATNFDEQIRTLKAAVRRFPKNPMNWVDVGRLYAASGQLEPARRALRVATSLAPHDRFCIRALCRLNIHSGDYASAHEIFTRNRDLLKDPWLLATAASSAGLAERPSPLPKRISLDVNSPVESFHRSELFEAFGIAELENGKDRAGRKALRAAWEQPSTNVVTHAQWVTRHVLPGLRDDAHLDFSRSSQASAHESFECGDIKSMASFIQLWKHEEPYSGIPYIFESYAYSLDEDFDKVIASFENARTQGLLTPLLLNNCIVALICKGDLVAAGKLFVSEVSHRSSLPPYTFKATNGLFDLASGRVATGLTLYEEAERDAIADGHQRPDHVFLNKVLALYRFGIPVERRFTKRVEDIRKTAISFPLKQLLRSIDAWAAKRASEKEVAR